LPVRAWAPLLVLPLLASLGSGASPPWVRMWALAVALGLACKWLTLCDARGEGRRPGSGRMLGYLLAWPGMDARAFLLGRHEYRDYVAMLLYGTMRTVSAHEPAAKLLDSRWAQIEPQREHWALRLRAGDPFVWRELLIGYYQGKVPAHEVFTPLETPTAYEASDFRFLRLSREGLLTEAYFYDAALARSRGNIELMRRRLQQVVALDVRTYYEYKMAQYLLAAN
jgi:hypothetical protein